MKLKVFTSFTGVGSQEMALRNINVDFEVVGISEVDKYALLAYDTIHNNNEPVNSVSKTDMLNEIKSKNIAYNFSTYKSEIPKNEEEIKKLYDAHIRNKNFGDIRLIDEKSLPDFDLFTYSYPCKNISAAGRQEGLVEGSNTQSSLLWECKRIIEYKKPKYLMMENVKNLISSTHKPELDKFISFLESIGYNNYWEVLNGKDYGVPQNRERVIMISILKEHDTKSFNFIKPFIKPVLLKDFLLDDKDVDSSFFIKPEKYKNQTSDLPHQHISYCIDASYWKGISVEQYITKRRRQLVQTFFAEPKLNVPISTYSTIRRLTPLECWRLMGYTDEDFFKAKNAGISNTKLYERAGRGIVVPMLEVIFKKLLLNI